MFFSLLCGLPGALRHRIAILCTVWGSLLISPVFACDGAQNIRLLNPVELSDSQRAEFRAMPALKVVAVGAPPMASYDEDSQTYKGIGIDVLCFITQELGLRFEIIPALDLTVADKIRQVQEGQADILIPLSYSSERAKVGLFTAPYYESHYAAIAHHDRHVSVRSIADLADYKVGYVQGVVFEPILQSFYKAV